MSVFNLSAALHRDVIPWRELDWPLDWDRHFGRVAPLRVEVGFGNGEFLQSLALDDPTSNHVGIEVSWVSIHRLLKRIHHNEIGNVRGLLGDGGFSWSMPSRTSRLPRSPSTIPIRGPRSATTTDD